MTKKNQLPAHVWKVTEVKWAHSFSTYDSASSCCATWAPNGSRTSGESGPYGLRRDEMTFGVLISSQINITFLGSPTCVCFKYPCCPEFSLWYCTCLVSTLYWWLLGIICEKFHTAMQIRVEEKKHTSNFSHCYVPNLVPHAHHFQRGSTA